MKLQLPDTITNAIASIVTNPNKTVLELYDETKVLHELDAKKIAGLAHLLAHVHKGTKAKHPLGVTTTIMLLVYALHRAGFSQYEIGLMTMTIGAADLAVKMSAELADAAKDAMLHEIEETKKSISHESRGVN